MAESEHRDRDIVAVDELLRELDELRELDRRRQAHAPGSSLREEAGREVDVRSRQVMDHFREVPGRHN